MPNWRRAVVPDGTYFFTLVTDREQSGPQGGQSRCQPYRRSTSRREDWGGCDMGRRGKVPSRHKTKARRLPGLGQLLTHEVFVFRTYPTTPKSIGLSAKSSKLDNSPARRIRPFSRRWSRPQKPASSDAEVCSTNSNPPKSLAAESMHPPSRRNLAKSPKWVTPK